MTIPDQFRAPLHKFQDYIEDARRASYQTFGDAFGRALNVACSEGALGSLTSRILPSPDFDAWYGELSGSVGGMGGQGALTWPRDTAGRVAVQLELLRRVDDERIDFFDSCSTFLESSGQYDEMVRAFAEHVLRPFARDFVRLMHAESDSGSGALQKALKDLRSRDELVPDLAGLLRNRITAVLFVDLDNFKAVNDTLGHQAGDPCLEQVAALICTSIEGKGTGYRYGGDEFAVLLPNFRDSEAAATAERIRVTIDEAKLGASPSVTASIGVAVGDPGTEAPELIAYADKAMYTSKHGSKNAVTVSKRDG